MCTCIYCECLLTAYVQSSYMYINVYVAKCSTWAIIIGDIEEMVRVVLSSMIMIQVVCGYKYSRLYGSLLG